MKRFVVLVSLVIFVFINICTANIAKGYPMTVSHLRCEYLANPLGIDVLVPRLSWMVSSPEKGQCQSAYQIVAAASLRDLEKGDHKLWDTGKVSSDQTIQVPYQGQPLKAFSKCFWLVRVWDKNDKPSQWSETAFFTIGPLEYSDWKAEWIGTPPEDEKTARSVIPPSPLLRRSFKSDDDIECAYLYVTSMGDYEIRLNGDKVSDRLLSPEWTDFQKRVQYQTYDVSKMLQSGENVLGAMLGDGWYAGRLGPVRWDKNYPRRGPYGLYRRLLCRLDIVKKDGSVQTITSDGKWTCTDGPIKMADNFLGETYDAQCELPGWDESGFKDSNWKHVYIDNSINVSIEAQMNEPIRVFKEIKPVAVTEPSPNVYIFDLGQNIAGWSRIRLNEPKGKEIVLRHSEILDLNGSIYMENLKSAVQTDTFICDGKGDKVFEPHFTYHGFRFIEVTGLSEKPSLDMLTGIAFSSDPPVTGHFQCSQPMLNQLFQNINWSQRGNMHSVPTDCPQRDERMGWMGDALIFSQTAIFNMDMAAFFAKWVQDIRDAQADDGRYPDFAPHPMYPNKRFNDAPGWADAGVVVPWRLYENYGDTRILEEHYDSMVRFINQIVENNPNFMWENSQGNQYSDWLNGNTISAENYPETGAQIPYILYTTAYYYHSTSLLAKIAQILNKTEDAKRFNEIKDKIREQFIKNFVNDDGTMMGNTQAGYAIALNFGLIPRELQETAAENLYRAFIPYNGRLSTGFHSTLAMMKQLTKWGYSDMAYKLVESKRFPSWGYSIEQGATTIWERWDAFVKGRGFQSSGMNSFNHYGFGAVGEWMYQTILGIVPDETSPAYKHFFIKPVPGGSLTWAKGSYMSIRGKIAVDWQIKDSLLHLNIEIPTNTSATIVVPTQEPAGVLLDGRSLNAVDYVQNLRLSENSATFDLASGTYSFTAKFDKESFDQKSFPFLNCPHIISEKTLYHLPEKATVVIENDDKDAEIRYTLDGSIPTTESLLYSKPVVLDTSAAVKACCFKKGYEPSAVSDKAIGVIDPEKNGISYAYYEGEWKMLPDFSKLTPIKTGKVYDLKYDPVAERPEHYGIRFTGYVKIPVEGEYTFYTLSDDGSSLYINDVKIVDNDGLHDKIEVPGSIHLTAGRHKIQVDFFQETGGQMLAVSMSGPDFEKQIIPASMLFPKK